MKRLLAVLFAALALGACTPMLVQQAGQPPTGFQPEGVSGPSCEQKPHRQAFE